MDLHVQPDPVHAKPSKIPVPFSYSPSDDGTDENLLILLHGLGDTHIPFAKLGASLKLPQTATLAIRAPEQIPYLYEPAYQWYESFDLLGELLQKPNPTPALDLLSKVFEHLITDCHWAPQKIHLLGFAQGGSLAVEFCLRRWKTQLTKHPDSFTSPLGSVVSVCGPVLEYPTVTNPCPTPLLVFQRKPPAESALPSGAIAAFKKGFARVRECQFSGEGMPRSKPEWEPLMRLWSESLSRRQMSGLYEVMSDIAISS